MKPTQFGGPRGRHSPGELYDGELYDGELYDGDGVMDYKRSFTKP